MGLYSFDGEVTVASNPSSSQPGCFPPEAFECFYICCGIPDGNDNDSDDDSQKSSARRRRGRSRTPRTNVNASYDESITSMGSSRRDRRGSGASSPIFQAGEVPMQSYSMTSGHNVAQGELMKVQKEVPKPPTQIESGRDWKTRLLQLKHKGRPESRLPSDSPVSARELRDTSRDLPDDDRMNMRVKNGSKHESKPKSKRSTKRRDGKTTSSENRSRRQTLLAKSTRRFLRKHLDAGKSKRVSPEASEKERKHVKKTKKRSPVEPVLDELISISSKLEKERKRKGSLRKHRDAGKSKGVSPENSERERKHVKKTKKGSSVEPVVDELISISSEMEKERKKKGKPTSDRGLRRKLRFRLVHGYPER